MSHPDFWEKNWNVTSTRVKTGKLYFSVFLFSELTVEEMMS